MTTPHWASGLDFIDSIFTTYLYKVGEFYTSQQPRHVFTQAPPKHKQIV